MSFERSTVLFFCAIAALFLIGFTAHCISHNVEVIDSKFTTAENASYYLSFAYENLTADYHADKNNIAVIQADEKALHAAQGNYITADSALGKLISKDTFCKMLNYSKHINDLTPTTYTIDDSKLKTSEENTKIKHDILFALFDDKKSYHNVFASVRTLFTDKSVDKYKRSDCDVAKENKNK